MDNFANEQELTTYWSGRTIEFPFLSAPTEQYKCVFILHSRSSLFARLRSTLKKQHHLKYNSFTLLRGPKDKSFKWLDGYTSVSPKIILSPRRTSVPIELYRNQNFIARCILPEYVFPATRCGWRSSSFVLSRIVDGLLE